MDGLWLHLYPGIVFLSRGPPADLAARVRFFSAARRLVREAQGGGREAGEAARPEHIPAWAVNEPAMELQVKQRATLRSKRPDTGARPA